MAMKKLFIKPEVLRELELLGDGPILQGSVSDNTTVVSMGQEVKDYDISDGNFNHQWE